MPKFDSKFSLGNIITLISMAIGGLWVIAELKASDGITNQRLTVLEKVAARVDTDRDIIIEIRSEIKALRAELRRRPGE